MPGEIVVSKLGGPEVLKWRDSPPAGEKLGAGQARVRHTAIGLNFIDTYFRSGLYAGPEPPFCLGQEAAGVIEAVGPALAGGAALEPGQRVAYTGVQGTYREQAVVPADRLVPLPDDIDDRTAAAVLLKGLTTEYLVRRTFVVAPGQTILVHAAAGGVGLLLCQWAKALGARVIGTVGSEEKAELARSSGCDETILYRQESFKERVLELTGGSGVPVVYDSVGKDTFEDSLDCLTPRGLMVTFGQSSGKVPPLDVTLLSRKGSLFLTRPTLATHIRERSDLLAAAEALFQVLREGSVRVHIGQTFPLREAQRAHIALESRATTGSTLLIP